MILSTLLLGRIHKGNGLNLRPPLGQYQASMPQGLHTTAKNDNIVHILPPGEGHHDVHGCPVASHFLGAQYVGGITLSIHDNQDAMQRRFLAIGSRWKLNDKFGADTRIRGERTKECPLAIGPRNRAGVGLILTLASDRKSLEGLLNSVPERNRLMLGEVYQ